MRTAFTFLAIIACAAAVRIFDTFADRSISSIVVNVIEDLRDHMPCGFPGLGIPPLAPFEIPHREINIDMPVLKLQGSVDNFHLIGLNDFEVAEMKVNAITSKVTYRFIFNNVNVDTLYDLNMELRKAGFTINMIGKGPGKFTIKDLSIWGTMKYSLGVVSGKLKLKSLEMRAHISEVDSDIEGILGEGVFNQKMNDVLAEAVQIAINENEDLISKTIEELALPVVNSALKDITLSDLVSGIGGGAKEPCILPEA